MNWSHTEVSETVKAQQSEAIQYRDEHRDESFTSPMPKDTTAI